jgi:hypothetical protein
VSGAERLRSSAFQLSRNDEDVGETPAAASEDGLDPTAVALAVAVYQRSGPTGDHEKSRIDGRSRTER